MLVEQVMREVHFAPVEWKIMTLLSDGFKHGLVEMRNCLQDELAEDNAINVHTARIRAKISRYGLDLVVRDREYWLVRSIGTDNR